MVDKEPIRTRLPEAGRDAMLGQEASMRRDVVYSLPPSRLGAFVDARLGGVEDQPFNYELPTQLISEMVDKALERVTPEERTVMKLRWGLVDGKLRTQAAVAKEIGRSRTTVRRRERSALRKLTDPSNFGRLSDYLG